MLRFSEFESLGLTLAAITEVADGDFARPGGRNELDAFKIAGLAPRPVATVRQVHGIVAHIVGRDNIDAIASTSGDALITREANVAIAVRVADCVPVFLFDRHSRSLGIVHAGRRGTFDGVAARAVRAMCRQFQAQPKSIHALIGPSAGPCCYEVDQATADEFGAKGLPHSGRRLDLWRANEMQLEAEGLAQRNIVTSAQCTICGHRFHSFRATGASARNLAIAAL